MSDLRERLEELADVAARHSRSPGPQVPRRRARRRRLRRIGGTAMLVVLAVVAGLVGTDRRNDRPAPLTPTPVPTVAPTSTTIRARATPLSRWTPSATPLRVKAQPGPYPGPDPGGIVRDVTSMVRGCRDKSRVRLWIRAQGKVWLIAARPPPPGRRHVCLATALMNQGGGGGLSGGYAGITPLHVVTFAGGGENGELGVVSGTVTKRAVRLRVLFRKGPPLDLVPVAAGGEFPLNFWAGLFVTNGPERAEGQLPVPAVERVLAFDRAGDQIAACRIGLNLSSSC